MVKQYIPEEAELNPELYGLRRSHRERRGPAIVESDSEEDVAPSRKRKRFKMITRMAFRWTKMKMTSLVTMMTTMMISIMMVVLVLVRK